MASEQRGQEMLTGRWGNFRTLAVGIMAGVVLLIAALGAFVWWQVHGTWHSTPVISMSPTNEALEYDIWIGCYRHGEVRSSVPEDDKAVLVTVEINGEVDKGLMCAGLVRVTLNEPLGDREVFDGATGDSVPTR